MTRKSPPRRVSSHGLSAQILSLKIGVLLALAVQGTAGCSWLSPRQDSLTDYAEARRSIENPVGVDAESPYGGGVFRPEGVSADRQKGATDFLDRLGLRSSRRKNIERARSLYTAGDELFEQAKQLQDNERAKVFRQAAAKYGQAAENWKSSGLEQDALLMAAESRFFAEDFYQAEQLYAQLVKEYPRNRYLDHIDSRRFEIADYWLKIDATAHKPFLFVNFSDNKLPWNDTGGHGKRVLEGMRLDNPTGRISDDATMRLAVEQFEKGDYESAAGTFEELRMTYPDSEHLFNAQFLELQSLLASYQGYKYSSDPVTEAQKRVKRMVKQFPRESSKREQDLNQAYAKIRFLLAERIWEQAEYRRKRSEYGSAKFHYQRILDEYSDTPFGEQARGQLAELQDKPDDPPQRFAPLVKIFGGTTDERPWLKNRDATSQ